MTGIPRHALRIAALAITCLWMNNAAASAASRVFWSGHSLTDRPIPQMTAAISESLGTPISWNKHSMAGASMEARTRGRPPDPDGWDGYRQGNNRDTAGMDVIEEFRTGETVGGDYDVLIVTEVHDFLWSVLRGDTVRLLRHYHERFIAGNPQGRTFLYQAWYAVADKRYPQTWLDYERAAEPVWQCLATRINLSLELEGREDRMNFIPAGLALVELVRDLTTDAGIPGITAATTTATLDRILRDQVHLTDLGAYYIGLVSYAFINDRSPVGAWSPGDIDAEAAGTLQQTAWAFYNRYRADNRPLSMEECSARIRDSFAQLFWEFLDNFARVHAKTWHEKIWLEMTGAAKARRNTREWQDGFADDSPLNPLRFDPATDAGIWHPAP